MSNASLRGGQEQHKRGVCVLMCIGGQMGAWGWKFEVCMSICDTYKAVGPHNPSGMWDFQVQNRPCRGRRAGTNSRKRRGEEEYNSWFYVFTATKGRIWLVIVVLCLIYPPVTSVGKFHGRLKWEVFGMTDGKQPSRLQCHCSHMWWAQRRESGTAATQTDKQTWTHIPKNTLSLRSCRKCGTRWNIWYIQYKHHAANEGQNLYFEL